MRSPADARLMPIVLYLTGVLQPVGEADLLAAAESMRSGLGITAAVSDLRAALGQARERQLVWNLGRRVFSLTAQGDDALRSLGMHRLRDKERILRLRARARGV